MEKENQKRNSQKQSTISNPKPKNSLKKVQQTFSINEQEPSPDSNKPSQNDQAYTVQVLKESTDQTPLKKKNSRNRQSNLGSIINYDNARQKRRMESITSKNMLGGGVKSTLKSHLLKNQNQNGFTNVLADKIQELSEISDSDQNSPRSPDHGGRSPGKKKKNANPEKKTQMKKKVNESLHCALTKKKEELQK